MSERAAIPADVGPAFAGASILVVGGAGFVGSNLVHRVLSHDPRRVVVVDNLLSAEADNVPDDPRVTFVHGSIADERLLRGLPADLDYVFHLATYHGNQSSIHDPIADHENNLVTTLRLFDWLKDVKSVKRVVYASAGCTVAEKTYGEVGATAEDAPVSLYHDSPYQISKIVGEFYGNFYCRRHGLPVVKARFQNVYGPREILGAGNWRGTPATVWRNVTPTFIYQSLARRALPLENGGIASRDFIYVDDIVEGLLRCAAVGQVAGVYNLASGVETTIRTLAEKVNTATGNPAPADIKPAREWDRSGNRYGSTELAERELGFVAATGLDEGLARTVAWTRANLDLIQRCMSRHAAFVDIPAIPAGEAAA